MFDKYPLDARAFDAGSLSQALQDSVTVSDASAKQITLRLSDSASASDAIATTGGFPLADSVTVTDAHSISVELVLEDSVSVTDANDVPEPEVPREYFEFPSKPLPRRFRFTIQDSVSVSDDQELDFTEGIPTRRQKRELALLLGA